MTAHYLAPLTWLRAIAALFVVISHGLRTAEIKYAPADEPGSFLPLHFLDLGTFGVYLFFALSGCTLFISSQHKLNNIGQVGSFYMKRFMRIWPAFAFSLALYLVFIEVFTRLYTSPTAFWGHPQLSQAYTATDVLQYLTLTFNFSGTQDLFIGPYWSLPVEFQYYLMLPLVVALMRIKSLTFVAPVLMGAGLYALGQASLIDIARDEVFRMAFVFFGGVLIAKAYPHISLRLPFAVALCVLAGIIGVAGLFKTEMLTPPSGVPFFSDLWNVYGTLALASLSVAIITKAPQKPSKMLEVLHQYGEVSYSVYLFHMLFVAIAALCVVNFEIYGSALKLSFILSFSVIGSFLFSIMTYRYIEEPSIRFGRKF